WSSAVFPTPGSPWTKSVPLPPFRTVSSSCLSAASSSSRPTSSRIAGCSPGRGSRSTSSTTTSSLPWSGEPSRNAIRRFSAGQRDAVEFPPGADAELGIRPAEVPLDGAGAEEEPGADLGVGQPLRCEAYDLHLLRGQVVSGLGDPLTG